MGLPLTAQIVNAGRYESYPLYVWFVDHPAGPVWREIDASFDEWDRRTGPHLAFFVDPFQREEWARDFLQRLIDREAADGLLDARRLAQTYFRERLAEHACLELWIPEERLPVAVIAAHWQARRTVLCRVPRQEDVRRLLDRLTAFARTQGGLPNWHPERGDGWPSEDQRLREVRQITTSLNLDSRPFQIATSDLGRLGRGIIDDHTVGPAVQWLRDRMGQKPDRSSFAAAASVTGTASLDDLVLLAESIVGASERLSQRYRHDHEARNLAQRLRLFASLLTELRGLREELERIAADTVHSEDRRIEAAAEHVIGVALPRHLSADDLDRRLALLLGPHTFARLLDSSRAALRAAEAIRALSDAIHELHHDLSACLLGFWKASEIEGRRLLVDLLAWTGSIPVWDDATGSVTVVDNPDAIAHDFTAGSLAWAMRNARFGADSPVCGLPLSTIGERMHLMAHASRNRFIHRTNLNDIAALESSRELVAKPPEGILPLTVHCIDRIAHESTSARELTPDQQTTVFDLVRLVERGNASALVPRHLSRLRGSMRQRYCAAVVEKLEPNWVKDKKRVNQDWVRELLTARGAIP